MTFLSLRLVCQQVSQNVFPKTAREASGAVFSREAGLSLWRDSLKETYTLVCFAISRGETQGTSSYSRGTYTLMEYSRYFCILVAMVDHYSCLTNTEAKRMSKEEFSGLEGIASLAVAGWQLLTFCEQEGFGELRAWEDSPLIVCPWFPPIPI